MLDLQLLMQCYPSIPLALSNATEVELQEVFRFDQEIFTALWTCGCNKL